MRQVGIGSDNTSPSDPQTNGHVERYSGTVVRPLLCFTAEHQRDCGILPSLLTAAYNTQVHASAAEILFSFVSPRRLQRIGSERLLWLIKVEERTEDASKAAKQYVEDLETRIS